MATISLTRIKREFHSIRWRILLAYLLIITIAFLVIGMSLLQLMGDYMFNQRVKENLRIADSLSEQLSELLYTRQMKSLYTQMRTNSIENGYRVLLIDRYGVVQADSTSMMNGSIFRNSEAAEVIAGHENAYGLYDTGNSRSSWFRVAVNSFSMIESMTGVFVSSCKLDGQLFGALVLITPLQDIYESLQSMRLRITAWLVVVAAAVMIVNLFMIRSITRPIRELREGIGQMADGDFSVRVNVHGRNEFAELATAFNSMSEKLERLDTTRSQFVSNASHELKTPLSTMKILIETLLYQNPLDPDMCKEFLSDANKEIDRLNRITSDLLKLVSLEQQSLQLDIEEVDMNQLLLEQVRRLAPLARENGIELRCTTTRDDVSVAGDRTKLEEVLYNIIDNAIKYTNRGGEVNATTTRSGKRVLLRIADTGRGIPSTDLPHIFDRFYRVDKARSRATGGTGLGLSIVKQIVSLHSGTIKAESEEGQGSVFTIELPAYVSKEKEAVS